MDMIDQPVDVRQGEELDPEKVNDFLLNEKVIAPSASLPAIRQFPGGASNLTYLIQYPDRELVLRRPPFGQKAKSAHDMLREARLLERLKPIYPFVPEVVATCEDHSYLHCDFYVMERLVGLIPRKDLPESIASNETTVNSMCKAGLDQLIALHQIDVEQHDLQDLGKGAGYVTRQIAGWSDRYRKAKTDDAASFEKVMTWLAEFQPNDVATCIIHNDFRFDNLVFDKEQPEKVIGVLDWEMATLGDPLMDLGNSLAYWVQGDDDDVYSQMRLQPTHTKGMLTREEVIDYYLDKTGITCDNFDFYEVYGMFRLAVILQQIYYRFYHKQTTNPRFAPFGQLANYLEQRCLAKISQSRIG